MQLPEDKFEYLEDEFTRKFPLLKSIDNDLLLTPKNIANLIGVHEETVRRWCRKGYLKSISPFGRYKIQGTDFKAFAFQWYCNKDIES